MASIYEIPITNPPQTFTISLGGVIYTLTLQYRNASGWILDIADVNGNAILTGIPLVTGANLLAQYAYLGIGGSLYVLTTSNTDAVPTFTNLGTDSNLYFVTNP